MNAKLSEHQAQSLLIVNKKRSKTKEIYVMSFRLIRHILECDYALTLFISSFLQSLNWQNQISMYAIY